MLWESVRQLKSLGPDGLWCFLGDFNNIRHPSERVGVSQRGGEDSSISEFNDWISDLEVVEVPSVGRRFTWFRPNGTAKSKLDRFLVSHDWLNRWPGCTQFILDRNFSDHCPILLKSKTVDWGPKPFRVLDCWLKDKSFDKVVSDCWMNLQPRGWGGYALKEKIKKLKERLKTWNREQFGDTYKKVQRLESELNRLEDLSTTSQLSPKSYQPEESYKKRYGQLHSLTSHC